MFHVVYLLQKNARRARQAERQFVRRLINVEIGFCLVKSVGGDPQTGDAWLGWARLVLSVFQGEEKKNNRTCTRPIE